MSAKPRWGLSLLEMVVAGALLAIRKMGSFVGLRRGLDSVLDI